MYKQTNKNTKSRFRSILVGGPHGDVRVLARNHGLDVLQLIVPDVRKGVVESVYFGPPAGQFPLPGGLELVKHVQVLTLVVLLGDRRRRQSFQNGLILVNKLPV